MMAQADGCFGRISPPQRCWAPPGVRPQAPRQVVREYGYAYTAVAPACGLLPARILPYANTARMNLFLEPVAQPLAAYVIVRQVDHAGWHTAHALKIPENIRLIPHPSSSPALNPVEHIWDEVRETWFHNRVLQALSKVVDTLAAGLRSLAAHPARVRSMTNFPHFRVIH
jgi:DDE superfamily endonuclease